MKTTKEAKMSRFDAMEEYIQKQIKSKVTPQQIADTRTPRFKEVITNHEQPQYEPTMIVSKPSADFTEREKFLIQFSLRNMFDFGRSITNADRFDMISILEKLGLMDKAVEMANDLNS